MSGLVPFVLVHISGPDMPALKDDKDQQAATNPHRLGCPWKQALDCGGCLWAYPRARGLNSTLISLNRP